MKFAHVVSAAVIGGLSFPVSGAAQNMQDIRDGVEIICILAGCGQNQQQRQPQPQGNPRPQGNSGQATVRRAAPAPADENVRMDQSALNHLGFAAGPADGRAGANTRNAVAAYQGYMGYPATGQLADFQRSGLWNAYNWSQAGGGGGYGDVIAAEGQRGLLKAHAAEARGERYHPFGQRPVEVAAPAPPAPTDGATMSGSNRPAPLPDFGGPALPELPETRPTAVSMADQCRSVEIMTQANGRMMEAGRIDDAKQALDEQFCAARGYSMTRAQTRIAEMEGVSDEQLAQQCDGLVATMAEQTAMLGRSGPAEVTESAQRFVAGFGRSADQLTNIGEVCLGVGYQTNKADVAMAAAMLLVGSGAHPYAELFGHHLRQGFGANPDPEAAAEWYGAGLDALDQGMPPVLLPAQSASRAAVIREALGGEAALPVSSTVALPDFGAQSN